MARLTPLQLQTLGLINAGKVYEENTGTGSWRIFGANPGVVGKLRAAGYVGSTYVNKVEYRFTLTDAGRAALVNGEVG